MLNNKEMPSYVDGEIKIYEIINDSESDFPEEKLKLKETVTFRLLSVFDKTRYEMQRVGHEVTMKVVIPRFFGVNPHEVAIIGNVQHEIFNVAHTETKNGFLETELTLIKPERERKFLND